MGKMPTVSKQNTIDREGSAALEKQFSKEMIFIQHSGNKDFGIDYSVELIDADNESTLGHFVSIQLKSHRKIKFDSDGNYSQSVKAVTVNYWLNINMPIIMVLVDLSTNKIYGIDVKKAIRKNFQINKMETQNSVSIKVNKNNIFSFKTCLYGTIEFEKYNILCSSAIDSYNIYNFLNYINDYSNRDWHMLVDDYQDLTREILSFSDKYAFSFSLDENIVRLREKMYETLKDNLYDGILKYGEYIEQNRTDFNKYAIEYLFELTHKICKEIDNDRTLFLEKNLFKFKRLKKIIEDYGKPAWNEKWSGSALNALNCDYDFEVNEN